MKTIKTIIQSNIKAQIQGVYVAPVILASAPGAGKTSLLREIAEECGCTHIYFSMGSISSETLSGIPDFVEEPDMAKYSDFQDMIPKGTRWSVPEIIGMANKMAETTNVVLSIEDIHETNMATEPYLLEFLLERKLGQFSLAKNVAIVGTMNDSEEASFRGMSSAVRNRLAILKYRPTFESWYEKIGRKYHFFISSFLKSNPHFWQEEEQTGIEGFGSPRAYEFLSNTLKMLDDEFVKTNIKLLAEQYISNDAAIALEKHVAYISKINFEDMVNKKEIPNISEMGPLDQMVHSYIVNFIKSKEEIKFLFNVIEKYIEESSFIGFLLGELASRMEEEAPAKIINIMAGVEEDEEIKIKEEVKNKISEMINDFLF